MSRNTNISKRFVKFDKVLTPLILIIIPVSILRGVLEYASDGFDMYVLRDIVNVSVMFIGLGLYKLHLLRKSKLFVLCIYSIALAILFTFIIGVKDPQFTFETSFLEAEMILSLLIFAIGLLVHFRHIAILLLFNVFFILFCSLTTGGEYPAGMFVFYFALVNGAGVMAYAGQRAFVSLNTKIKDANKLITQRNEELKSLNQSKDQLFRVIGHDLRTPFFQLISLVEMLDDAKGKDEADEIKSLIKESAHEGNRLLEDLLGWGKKYQKQESIEITQQKAAPIVDRVIDFSRLKARTKGVTLTNKVDPKLELYLNATMMETVIRNLVANAIKFSYRGSEVLIKSEENKEYVKIEVIDIGIGMKPEQLDALLEKDKNISTKGTENEEGSGLGLNIAKKLVEKQYGTLEIASVYGKGTIVTLSFPQKLSL